MRTSIEQSPSLGVILFIQLLAFAPGAWADDGMPLWTNRYNGGFDDYPFAMAVDNAGNVFVTGSSQDYSTVGYSTAGSPLWTNRYQGADGNDSAKAIAVDSVGNIFVTGKSSSTLSNDYGHYATIAYSGAGVPLWTNLYQNSRVGAQGATAIAVDNSGNVFVTGSAEPTSPYSDYATVAYSGAGLPLWTNVYHGPTNGADDAIALAVDHNGNVFVTGASTGVNGYSDYATVAYSGGGVPVWTNRYHGQGSFHDSPIAIAVDSNGNAFVTGESFGSDNAYQYATVAYSGAGLPLWTNRYSGPGNGPDYAAGIAVDSNGNVFVTGSSMSALTNYEFATLAYSGLGVPLWTNRYSQSGRAGALAAGIAIDSWGDVYVTGSSRAASGDSLVTLAYSGAGVPVWTNQFSDVNGSDAVAIALDHWKNVIVTGTTSSGANLDYVTIEYSAIVPRIRLSIVPDGSGGFFIRAQGPPNFTCQLQSGPTLSGSWTTGAAQTASASGVIEFHQVGPLESQTFYRTVQQ